MTPDHLSVTVERAGGPKPSQHPQLGVSLLEPLREGKTVVFRVDDPRLPKKKRAPEPRLFLIPFNRLGDGLSTKVLASFEAHGSEVFDTRDPVVPMTFIRLGLSGRMATAIANELNQVFR